MGCLSYAASTGMQQKLINNIIDIAKNIETKLFSLSSHAAHEGDDGYISDIMDLFQTKQYERVQYMYFCNQLGMLFKARTEHKIDDYIDTYLASFTQPSYCAVADAKFKELKG